MSLETKRRGSASVETPPYLTASSRATTTAMKSSPWRVSGRIYTFAQVAAESFARAPSKSLAKTRNGNSWNRVLFAPAPPKADKLLFGPFEADCLKAPAGFVFLGATIIGGLSGFRQ